jgi:pimeloyl-ACP methyl ester carboxylesterase
MQAALPDLRKCVMYEGAGHWLQQERADSVNRELLEFFGSVS